MAPTKTTLKAVPAQNKAKGKAKTTPADDGSRTSAAAASSLVASSKAAHAKAMKDENSVLKPFGLEMFPHLDSEKRFEIDPNNPPDCGPLCEKPTKPEIQQAPKGQAKTWCGILMGNPRDVFKPGKRKSTIKYVVKSCVGNHAYLWINNDGTGTYIDEYGTMVTTSDIWFVRGWSRADALQKLAVRKQAFDDMANLRYSQEMAKWQIDMVKYEEDLYQHFVNHGLIQGGAAEKLTRKRKRIELMEARDLLEEAGYTVVQPSKSQKWSKEVENEIEGVESCATEDSENLEVPEGDAAEELEGKDQGGAVENLADIEVENKEGSYLLKE